MLTILLGLLLNTANAADTYYLESPAVSTRSEVGALLRRAQAEGWKARVTRRYTHGAGWQYVLLVENFDGLEEAESAAGLLAGLGGTGIAVYRYEGRAAQRLNSSRPAGQANGDSPPTADAAPDAAQILRRAVRAMGGSEGGIDRLEAASHLRFSFERTVMHDSGATRAEHSLWVHDQSLRLETQIVEGEGTDSVAVVHGDEAWLRSGDETLSRDPEQVRSLLSEFTPAILLAYPLHFSRLAEGDPLHAQLRLSEDQAIDGGGHKLVCTGTGGLDLLELTISADTWKPQQVRHSGDAGEVLYRFEDWREIGTGLVVPFNVELVRDGEILESLKITELFLPAKLDDDLFEKPRG